MIFIYSGHGYENGVFTSLSEKINFNQIKQHFNATNLPSFKDTPKIYIIDACHSSNPNLPIGNKYKNTDYKTDAQVQIKGGHEIQNFQFCHPFANVLEMYGNTP